MIRSTGDGGRCGLAKRVRRWPRIARALVLLLVLGGHLGLGLSALMTGQAFGAGGHHHLLLHERVLHDLALPDGTAASQHADAGGCDHCCHAQAHLTALLSHHPLLTQIRPSLPRGGEAARWCSHLISPPTRPPKSTL